MTILAGIGAAVLLSAAPPGTAASQAPRKHIDIPRTDIAPTLDDYVDGRPVGVAVSDFLQREPGDLVPPSEPTTAQAE